MTVKCKMTGKETMLPCSASGCPLFGDCLVDYEKATRKPMTNADRIRAMSDEELAKFLECLAFSRETPWSDPFARKFCDNCPTIRCMVKEYGKEMEFNECDFVDGKCPHGDNILWWLKEPVEEVK